jgi:hypothetical protein
MIQPRLSSISVHRTMSAGQPCASLISSVQKYVTQLKLSKLPSLCSCRLLGIVDLDSSTICRPVHLAISQFHLSESPENGSKKFQTPATMEKAEVTNTRTRQRKNKLEAQYQKHLYCATRQVEALYQKPANQPGHIFAPQSRATSSFSYTCLLAYQPSLT